MLQKYFQRNSCNDIETIEIENYDINNNYNYKSVLLHLELQLL